MIVYDKAKIKEQLTHENIFELLEEWGGEPQFTSFGIVSTTICHNLPGQGSRKLYYYFNDNNGFGLFKCFTGCENDVFDIFELVIKIMALRNGKRYDLNDAVHWIAARFHIAGDFQEEQNMVLKDWKILAEYDRIKDISFTINSITLEEYDKQILDRFNYKVKIQPWLNENISQEAIDKANISYYPGGEQIVIPHYDINNRLIGIRGRTLIQEEGEKYGKYRPLKINNKLYNHPLGMNLYNLNNSKSNIAVMKKAIVFESEKSALQYQSAFGFENDISVACCGSSLSAFQVQLLEQAGAQEIVLAFDRDFEEISDEKFKRIKRKLINIRNRYHNNINVSIIFDKRKITKIKASPIDEGPDQFLKLFNERIIL